MINIMDVKTLIKAIEARGASSHLLNINYIPRELDKSKNIH